MHSGGVRGENGGLRSEKGAGSGVGGAAPAAGWAACGEALGGHLGRGWGVEVSGLRVRDGVVGKELLGATVRTPVKTNGGVPRDESEFLPTRVAAHHRWHLPRARSFLNAQKLTRPERRSGYRTE